MLSYQHGYHAGNAADVHKHALLAAVLSYMTRKDKPLGYTETHAGRGLYDLGAPEAVKTGEAAAGIGRAEHLLPADHPYRASLARIRAKHGQTAYPGSPLIAADLLRPTDTLTLAELHPGEHAALCDAMAGQGAVISKIDGLAMALSKAPPRPRRGLLLCDPSYEVKADYDAIARWLPQVHAKWNVGVLMLWYPILTDGRHRPMVAQIRALIPAASVHEVAFAPARPGHGMRGSGMITVNAPYGMEKETALLDDLFMKLR
ncbi:23S rRNA (adenine(2030)-N(6))-methyltransferase RlmJ [Oceaniglobus indicus]|uniref:23S rRNA (adenine(2030)-N(6))-methyltransferase RlmJ n=1 Tax=Oceaniglobus indicus TaxID=2047749 RepID=UPI000C18BA9C|nr:23S rRNA (adenine(2030)-N(6))-methyltransferase RlmJ [Oceaniglobus indicus]